MILYPLLLVCNKPLYPSSQHDQENPGVFFFKLGSVYTNKKNIYHIIYHHFHIIVGLPCDFLRLSLGPPWSPSLRKSPWHCPVAASKSRVTPSAQAVSTFLRDDREWIFSWGSFKVYPHIYINIYVCIHMLVWYGM